MALFGKKKRKPGDPPPLGSLEHKLQVCRAYLAVWQRFFQFFSESLENKKLTAEAEKEFNRCVYQLAYDNFKFTQLMKKEFVYAKKLSSVLDKCVSLSQLKVMPEASFGALQVDWHEVFIGMNKAMGHLLAEMPPEELPEKQAVAKPAAKPAVATQAKAQNAPPPGPKA